MDSFIPAQDWFYVFKSNGVVTVARVAAFRSKRYDGSEDQPPYLVGLIPVKEGTDPNLMRDYPQARFVEAPDLPSGHYRHLSQLTEEQIEASKRY